MSWDDFVIGQGDKGNSAHVVVSQEGGFWISHNNVSYWITGAYLGAAGIIFKNTPEGEQLHQMILDKDEAKIERWLGSIVLNHCENIRQLIETHAEKAYQRGRCDQAEVMRNALMLT